MLLFHYIPNPSLSFPFHSIPTLVFPFHFNRGISFSFYSIPTLVSLFHSNASLSIPFHPPVPGSPFVFSSGPWAPLQTDISPQSQRD